MHDNNEDKTLIAFIQELTQVMRLDITELQIKNNEFHVRLENIIKKISDDNKTDSNVWKLVFILLSAVLASVGIKHVIQ
jgi:hypothetical protein